MEFNIRHRELFQGEETFLFSHCQQVCTKVKLSSRIFIYPLSSGHFQRENVVRKKVLNDPSISK